jgi:hypothetical protein
VFHTTTDANNWGATDAHLGISDVGAGVSGARPIKDASQDVTFRGVKFDAASGVWYGEAARKLKTCDLEDDLSIEGGRGRYVIWCARRGGRGRAGEGGWAEGAALAARGSGARAGRCCGHPGGAACAVPTDWCPYDSGRDAARGAPAGVFDPRRANRLQPRPPRPPRPPPRSRAGRTASGPALASTES